MSTIPTVSFEKPYVSCIRIGKQPILPPLLSPELRKEIGYIKAQAVDIEGKLRENMKLNNDSIRSSINTLCVVPIVQNEDLGNLQHDEPLDLSSKNIVHCNDGFVQTTNIISNVSEQNADLNIEQVENSSQLQNNDVKDCSAIDNIDISDEQNSETLNLQHTVRRNSYTLESPSQVMVAYVESICDNSRSFWSDCTTASNVDDNVETNMFNDSDLQETNDTDILEESILNNVNVPIVDLSNICGNFCNEQRTMDGGMKKKMDRKLWDLNKFQKNGMESVYDDNVREKESSMDRSICETLYNYLNNTNGNVVNDDNNRVDISIVDNLHVESTNSTNAANTIVNKKDEFNDFLDCEPLDINNLECLCSKFSTFRNGYGCVKSKFEVIDLHTFDFSDQTINVNTGNGNLCSAPNDVDVNENKDGTLSDCSSISNSNSKCTFISETKTVVDEKADYDRFIYLCEELKKKHSNELLKLLEQQEKEQIMLAVQFKHILAGNNETGKVFDYSFPVNFDYSDIFKKAYLGKHLKTANIFDKYKFELVTLNNKNSSDIHVIDASVPSFPFKKSSCDVSTHGYYNDDNNPNVYTSNKSFNDVLKQRNNTKSNFFQDDKIYKAASIINAAVRGYLIRRLFKTEHVTYLVQTIRDCLATAITLRDEPNLGLSELELQCRLLQQLTMACNELQDVFSMPVKRRIAIISADRQKRKLGLARKIPLTTLPLSDATKQSLRRKMKNSNMQTKENSTILTKCTSSSDCGRCSTSARSLSPSVSKSPISLDKKNSPGQCSKRAWR